MTPSAMTSGARGGALTMAGEVAKLVVQMIALVVLSRLLTPADFGLIAMVAVFMALGELIRDFGIPSAALSAPTLSRQQASNLFWISTGIGIAIGLALLLSTPLIVELYDQPQLASVIPIFALTLFLNGAQVQFRVHLARDMLFRALVVTDIAALVLALAVAIGGAIAGWGYYALALQALTYALCQLLFRAVAARWLPRLPRADGETLPLVKAGTHIGLSQLLTYGASNVDTIAIGAQWGSTALGYYNRAFQLLTTPLRATVGPMTNVVIPTATKARSEGNSVDSVLLRIQSPLVMVTAWIFGTSAGIAPVLIPFVLGSQWAPSVSIFQILAIGGAVQAMSYVNLWSFLLHGRTLSLLHYNVVTKIATIVLVIAASFISVDAVAWAYSIMLVISWPVGLIWLGRSVEQSSWTFFWNGCRVLVAAGAGYGASALVVAAIGDSTAPILIILLGVVVASAVFVAVLAALPAGRTELRAAASLARSLAARRK